MARQEAVRERILLATMVCIERLGMHALTVRDIAAEADVNIAAVNYYFGSKNALIEEVRERQLVTGFDEPLRELDERLDRYGDVKRALTEFLLQFVSDMVRYPRTAEGHLHDALTRQDYSGPAVTRLNVFLEGFMERARPALPGRSDTKLRLSVMQLWSAMLLLGILPHLFDEFSGLDLTDGRVQKQYVQRLVEHFFQRV